MVFETNFDEARKYSLEFYFSGIDIFNFFPWWMKVISHLPQVTVIVIRLSHLSQVAGMVRIMAIDCIAKNT